jgi:hypothetical protein
MVTNICAKCHLRSPPEETRRGLMNKSIKSVLVLKLCSCSWMVDVKAEEKKVMCEGVHRNQRAANWSLVKSILWFMSLCDDWSFAVWLVSVHCIPRSFLCRFDLISKSHNITWLGDELSDYVYNWTTTTSLNSNKQQIEHEICFGSFYWN